jgi:exonuclease SbcC
MNPQLKSITLNDFRSIRGTITVPLDAPVILIHGQNGVGKTSILSGIELALTGEVPSLGRVEPDYITHLVHKQATQGKVSISTSGLDGLFNDTELIVTRDGIEGTPLLSKPLSRFYSERCYLAQSALGRLLEIYQHKDARQSDSPLTEFVKDLLGLDQLDALIEGLHNAGDIRRLKGPVHLYWDIRDEIQRLESEEQNLSTQLSEVTSEVQRMEIQLKDKLINLESNLSELISNPDALLRRLQIESEERPLLNMTRVRRELAAAREEWQALSTSAGADERSIIAENAHNTRASLDRWRAGPGQKLQQLIEELSSLFADLPSPTATDPEFARVNALRAPTSEFMSDL